MNTLVVKRWRFHRLCSRCTEMSDEGRFSVRRCPGVNQSELLLSIKSERVCVALRGKVSRVRQARRYLCLSGSAMCVCAINTQCYSLSHLDFTQSLQWFSPHTFSPSSLHFHHLCCLKPRFFPCVLFDAISSIHSDVCACYWRFHFSLMTAGFVFHLINVLLKVLLKRQTVLFLNTAPAVGSRESHLYYLLLIFSPVLPPAGFLLLGSD